MPISVGIGLEKDGTRHIFGGISSNGKGGGEVWKVKNGFEEEKVFEGVKGGLTGRSPVPSQVFLCKVNEGAGNVGIVCNEPLVEVGEAKEGSDILDLCWGGPTCNALRFDGVHGQLTQFDNHSKVFHLVKWQMCTSQA